MMRTYDAVIFDLLTALLDSWTLWNKVAGSPEDGLRWRKHYLEITYRCGVYRPYEALVREAAVAAGLSGLLADELIERWTDLKPWPEAMAVLDRLAKDMPLAVVTNCSASLGAVAVRCIGHFFRHVITAESVGFYKPHPETYRAALTALGTKPERTLFVSGSAFDVPGAQAVGMPVFWHNRLGLPSPKGVVPLFSEPTLDRLPNAVLGC